MAGRKRPHAQTLRVDREFEIESQVPYKKLIMSAHHFKEPQFWQEESLIMSTAGIQVRYGFDDLRNLPVVYMRRDNATESDPTRKATYVTLEHRNVPEFLEWLDKQAAEVESVEFPNKLEKLEEHKENGMVIRTIKGGVVHSFFNKGEVLQLGTFRAKLAYDGVSQAHKFFINMEGKSETFPTWVGPTLELTHGVAMRLYTMIKHLHSLL